MELAFDTRQHGCRGTYYVQNGHGILVIENSLLRVSVLLSKGADILEFRYKPLDVDVLWRSAQPLRAPGTVLAPAFLDHYYGGWQESLPSGAGSARYRGAELGVHGEAPLLPWSATVVVDEPEQIAVRLHVRLVRTPFMLTRVLRVRADTPQLYVSEELANTAAVPMPYIWGHHPALGPPLLARETICDVPGGTVRRLDAAAAMSLGIHSGDAGGDEFYWVEDLPAGWYALRNPAIGLGFALAWDVEVFPYLWNWRVSGETVEYPFWGSTRLWAVEPFSTAPASLDGALEPPVLVAGSTLQTQLVASIVTGPEPVVACGLDGTIRRAESGAPAPD
jgi:hypothetical protein